MDTTNIPCVAQYDKLITQDTEHELPVNTALKGLPHKPSKLSRVCQPGTSYPGKLTVSTHIGLIRQKTKFLGMVSYKIIDSGLASIASRMLFIKYTPWIRTP